MKKSEFVDTAEFINVSKDLFSRLGKSTKGDQNLLMAIMGQLRPNSQEVWINVRNVAKATGYKSPVPIYRAVAKFERLGILTKVGRELYVVDREYMHHGWSKDAYKHH